MGDLTLEMSYKLGKPNMKRKKTKLIQEWLALGAPLPVESTFSCDVLARSAKEGGRFQRGQGTDPSELKPGSIFLRRRIAGDWTHTGIVIKATPDAFMTMEGNTNDMGSREGYEVCRRFQSYKGRDFVTI